MVGLAWNVKARDKQWRRGENCQGWAGRLNLEGAQPGRPSVHPRGTELWAEGGGPPWCGGGRTLVKLDPRLEVGVKVCRARKKTAGCTAGPAERILRLRGNMDRAVKLLRAWKLCSEPESNGGTPEVERLVGADELVWAAAKPRKPVDGTPTARASEWKPGGVWGTPSGARWR